MIRRYAKSVVFDFILCVCVSVALAYTIPDGFYVSDTLRGSLPLAAGSCAALTAWFFVGAYSRRAAIIVAVLSVGGAAAAVAAGRASSADIFSDVPENPYIFAAILVLSALGVFLLSRTRAGCIVLFGVGVLIFGSLRFLYEKDHLAELLIFLVASASLYAFRRYRLSMDGASAVRPRFASVALIAVLVFALTVSMGAAAFYGIVRPLDPSARELKLITHYMSMQTLERLGIADRIPDPDDELDSEKTNDDEKHAKPGTEKEEKTEDGTRKDEKDTKDKETPNSLDSSNKQTFYVITYLLDKNLLFIIPIALALALLAAIGFKKLRRRRWLARIMKKPENEQVMLMYRFYIKKLRLMKIQKEPDTTLYRFAEDAAPMLRRFAAQDADFAQLTDIYVKAYYGGETISGEEADRYRAFHRAFYRNCRGHLGGFSYAFKFFAL